MSRQLNRRIDDFQERMDSNWYALIADRLSPERAREVIDAAGEVQWKKLSNEELDTIAPPDDPVLDGGDVLWQDLTFSEIDRIAEGADPTEVVRSHNDSDS